jgi:hypothetical protein
MEEVKFDSEILPLAVPNLEDYRKQYDSQIEAYLRFAEAVGLASSHGFGGADLLFTVDMCFS